MSDDFKPDVQASTTAAMVYRNSLQTETILNLQSTLVASEAELADVRSQKDKLFTAHGVEMTRADIAEAECTRLRAALEICRGEARRAQRQFTNMSDQLISRTCDAALSAPSTTAAPGMVLVPREPTREMWAAGGTVIVGYKARHHDIVVRQVWEAMIKASLSAS